MNEQNNYLPNKQSLAELKVWLVSRGINLSLWNRDSAKSVTDLWQELTTGEIQLQDMPPLRIVPVVLVIIRDGDKVLIELEQELDDNRIRPRNSLPSEKMQTGESYLEAATRCLKEELALGPANFELITSTYRRKEEENESPSYPGLCTRYIFHIIEVRVSGLPTTDFWTAESPQHQNAPVKRHHWAWRYETDDISL